MCYTFQRMKNPWVIIGVLSVVLFGGAIWFSSLSSERNNEGVTPVEHIKGSPDGPVVLVEYSDFQCPACKSFQPAVEQVIREYGESVRFEYKHFPLPIHRNANQAAVAAEAASQQGKFYEYHDLLFANQETWGAAAAPQTFFLQYANELGLDMDMFRRHMNSSVLRDAVREDLNEARALGLTGTPTFFLNGERMEIQTFPGFIEQIAVAVDPSRAASSTSVGTGAPGGSDVRFGI